MMTDIGLYSEPATCVLPQRNIASGEPEGTDSKPGAHSALLRRWRPSRAECSARLASQFIASCDSLSRPEPPERGCAVHRRSAPPGQWSRLIRCVEDTVVEGDADCAADHLPGSRPFWSGSRASLCLHLMCVLGKTGEHAQPGRPACLGLSDVTWEPRSTYSTVASALL